MWVAAGSGFVAVLALIGAGISLGYAKSQSKSTERQAIAAESQVEYMRRQVEVMELEAASRVTVIATKPEHRAADEVVRGAPYVPPWSVVARSKGGLVLANGGTEPAFDVQIDFDVSPARVDRTAWDRIDPRAAVNVRMFRAMGASPEEMTVRWRRTPDGEPMEWTTAV